MKNSENGNLLKKAIDTIQSLFNEFGDTEFKDNDYEKLVNNRWKIDLIIRYKIDRKSHKFLVEIKSSGEPRMIAQNTTYLKKAQEEYKGYPIMIAPFISNRGRDLCKELGIGFIDFAGNAYLKFDRFLIDRWGKENIVKEKRILKSLFSTKSTWAIRKLFKDLNRKWTMAEMSKESDVSIGQVYKILNKLENEGFLNKERGAIALARPGELLDAWVKIYRLDDHRIMGYYCPLKDRECILDSLKTVPKDFYALTLGAGVSLIAPFVRSTDLYLYIKENGSVIIKELKLTPTEFGGNIYLIESKDKGVFFDEQIINDLVVVSNLQLYLDLYNYPMRGKEQAEHLRETMMEV